MALVAVLFLPVFQIGFVYDDDAERSRTNPR
jgi:hypothetical protein